MIYGRLSCRILAEFLAPPVKHRIGDVVLTADVRDRLVFFGLSQFADNLFGTALSLFYQTIP